MFCITISTPSPLVWPIPRCHSSDLISSFVTDYPPYPNSPIYILQGLYCSSLYISYYVGATQDTLSVRTMPLGLDIPQRWVWLGLVVIMQAVFTNFMGNEFQNNLITLRKMAGIKLRNICLHKKYVLERGP